MKLSSPFCTHTGSAAFFDFDNTLLPGEASEIRFFRFLWRQGLVGWHEVRKSLTCLARHASQMSLQPLREEKPYLQGKRPCDIEPLAGEFCRNELYPRLSREGLARMDEHRRAGHHIVLVTGSLDFLVAPLASYLDVQTLLAATPERLDNRYTGRLVPPLPYGAGKRTLITALAHRQGLALPASYAYGDSPGDVELLQMVGYPSVVNPIRGMAAIARRHKWSVLRWT